MKFEELQDQWSKMKLNESVQQFHTPAQKDNIMNTIAELEAKARKTRQQMEWGVLPIIPMAFLFIYLFTSESWVASTGLLLVVASIIMIVLMGRKTVIHLEGQDQNSIHFLKSARKKLYSRIQLVQVISPIYMLLLIGGMFMYFSFILKDVSPVLWWFAHISLVLYGLFIYITSNKTWKKWIVEEINPIIADIDKVLDDE